MSRSSRNACTRGVVSFASFSSAGLPADFLAINYFWMDTGAKAIIESDIFVNDDYQWADGAVVSIRQDSACEICVDVCRQGGERLFDDRGGALSLGTRPNPFNDAAEIEFTITESGLTRMMVMDALGRNASVLLDEWLPAGRYREVLDGSKLATGMYHLVLQTPSQIVRRMVLLLK